MYFFFFQAEDGIRDRSPSRGLGDVYKRQDKPLNPLQSQSSSQNPLKLIVSCNVLWQTHKNNQANYKQN